jgi:hypothetical protein
MKTTLNLNDELLASAKAMAAVQQSTLTRLIEEGLRLRLVMGTGARDHTKLQVPKLPVFKGKGGIQSGINPLSNRSMLDALDA